MKKNPKRKAAREIFAEQICQNFVDEGVEEELHPQEASYQNASLSSSRASAPRKADKNQMANLQINEQVTSEELQQQKGALQIRETGWGLWRTVIVPPNAYVIHTRRGHKNPITLGLGTSFRYNPRTDSYLVVPAAVQTIGIVAQGVSKEKQGVNILAYVQWMINDFSIAYQRLDFSDVSDPMGIVSAQLREQAEAAIKDKISTMSVEEILADKAPIIEELTERLKSVAEGKVSEEDELGGLGIKIVTVQLKEAFVSSQKLWEHLQAPFRNEREGESRLSRLKLDEEIRQKELSNREKLTSSEARTQSEIEKFKAQKESESLAVVVEERIAREEIIAKEQEENIKRQEQQELARRLSEHKLQEEAEKNKQELALVKLRNEQDLILQQKKMELERRLQEKIAEEKVRIEELQYEEKLLSYEQQLKLKELANEQEWITKRQELEQQKLKNDQELQKIRLEHKLKLKEQEFQQEVKQREEEFRVRAEQKERQLTQEKTQQQIYNLISENDLKRRLIESLPKLAEAMPDIQELKSLQISGEQGAGFDPLATFLTKLVAIGQTLGLPALSSLDKDHQEEEPCAEDDSSEPEI